MADDWGKPEVLPAVEAESRVESTGGDENQVVNLVLSRLGNPDLNGITLKDYAIALIRYYTWNAAKKEIKALLTVGPDRYLSERKDLVTSVVKKLNAGGIKGVWDRTFSRSASYLEDTLDYDVTERNDLPEAAPSAAKGEASIQPVGRPIVFDRPRTTAMATVRPTAVAEPTMQKHSSLGCNPFAKNESYYKLLSNMKMVWPTRAGESDEDYYARVHRGFEAYRTLAGAVCE